MKNQSKKVDALLLALVEIQESIENGLTFGQKDTLRSNYAYIKVCFCGEDPKDFEPHYFNVKDVLKEEEAIKHLLISIKWALNKVEL